MPPKRRSGFRGRPRGRPSAAHSPVEDSRTPTPAQESEVEDVADAAEDVGTPLDADETAVQDDDQDNEDDAEQDGDDDDDADSGADATETPAKKQPGRKSATPSRPSSQQPAIKRRGFRGGTAWRGRNSKAKGPPNVQQNPLDYEGNPAQIVNDEVLLPEDAEGEKKVDDLGHLAGGREYRVRTFTIETKGERLYMLSTEPARCIGFRDSYLFFQKHRQLAKIVLSEEEKHSLIDRHIIPHSYKGRNIGVVTARSVFREFGAKIVIGGRKITDDYYVTAAREAGEIEGEIAVPDDKMPSKGEEYDRKRYVAWHGASAVYHSSAQAVGGVLQPVQHSIIHGGQGPPAKRRKIHVTGSNWMLEHARAASNFNSLLTTLRAPNANGQYDIYTNTMHYPAIYQHSHAKWEVLPTQTTASKGPPSLTSSHSSSTTSSPFPETPATPSAYPEITPYLARNAVTVDTLFAEPPTSTLGIPGASGVDAWGLGTKGLVDVDEDVIACLDEKSRKAFEEARSREAEWKMKWTVEADDGARRTLIRR